LIFKNWRGKAADEKRNERLRTTHHSDLLVTNGSEYVAEVVGEHSQFKIVLSKIGEKRTKNKGRKEQGNTKNKEQRNTKNKGF
jgi:hypothetical protein